MTAQCGYCKILPRLADLTAPTGEAAVSHQPTPAPNQSPVNRAVPWLLSALLIGNFLWRTLTAAHEYPMRSAQVLEMAVDALCIVGLVAVRTRLPAGLFWLALIAGLGLFAIRFNSDASWWTGHLTYSLLPR